MLFQFNYQFLSRKQFNITSTTTTKPNGCQKLKAPDVNGPVDHVAFVIHVSFIIVSLNSWNKY